MNGAQKPTKPVEPGPTCTEAERHRYAQDNAKWSAWLAEHPEDAEQEGKPPVGKPSSAAPSDVRMPPPNRPEGQGPNVDLGGDAHGGAPGGLT